MRYIACFFLFLFAQSLCLAEEWTGGWYIDAAQCRYLDFSGRHISFFDVHLGDGPDAYFQNTSFRSASIGSWDHSADWETCDFTDTWFGSGQLQGMPKEVFLKTRNFSEKSVPLSLLEMSLSDLDLTDFVFADGNFQTLDLSGSRLTNVRFVNAKLPKLTAQQLQETRNFKSGDFSRLTVPENFLMVQNAWSRTVWGGFIFRLEGAEQGRPVPELCFGPEADLTDAVFIRCDLSRSKNMTLEQVKSTWNYKTGRLHLVLWPEHIAEVLKTEFLPEPFDGGFYLEDPRGSFRGEMSEELCFTGDTTGLKISGYQPNLYCENAQIQLEKWAPCQTRNFRDGYFLNCDFLASAPGSRPHINANFQKTAFVGCKFENHFTGFEPEFPKIDLTDCVFIDCDLTESKNLTLEQVKSTWNYKAGRMSLCKWPEYIEKALEEEKKQ